LKAKRSRDVVALRLKELIILFFKDHESHKYKASMEDFAK